MIIKLTKEKRKKISNQNLYRLIELEQAKSNYILINRRSFKRLISRQYKEELSKSIKEGNSKKKKLYLQIPICLATISKKFPAAVYLNKTQTCDILQQKIQKFKSKTPRERR